MMQRIRDEAHRFAITFQRQKRKKDVASQLAEIPGLGPARVKVLLRHFGSVKRLRVATPDEIAEVRGIGPALAAAIVGRLGTGTPPDGADEEQASG
jgi:excinuclease ABC subunit C